MSFSPTFLDELRSRITLSDLIGRRVQLVKKGRSHLGLCPFHNERTPSFFVRDVVGNYRCFGCGAHGDAINFVMAMDGLAFPEAVERLAAEAGIALPVKNDHAFAAIQSQNISLFMIMEAAAVFFSQLLMQDEGLEARAYLKQRGVTSFDQKNFRLGWAPKGGSALKVHLATLGINQEAMNETGLIVASKVRGFIDRFRSRIMFPIIDLRGRVIAFGGRAMGEQQPKYLNSPETPLFRKSGTLYGLHFAQKVVRQHKNRLSPIVVEGYMDVIAMHRHGFQTALAPLGTALTDDQLNVLWKLSREPVLCFDGDSAGQSAAVRAAERALPMAGPGCSLRFAILPVGRDPDDLLAENGGSVLMRELIETAKPLADLLWDTEVARLPLDTPERRADLHRRWDERVKSIVDPLTRNLYKEDFAVRERALFPRVEDRNYTNKAKKSNGWADFVLVPKVSVAKRRIYKQALSDHIAKSPQAAIHDQMAYNFLALLFADPSFIEDNIESLSKIDLGIFELNQLLGAIFDAVGSSPGLDAVALRNQLEQSGVNDALSAVMHKGSAFVHFVAKGGDGSKRIRERATDLLSCFLRCEKDAQENWES